MLEHVYCYAINVLQLTNLTFDVNFPSLFIKILIIMQIMWLRRTQFLVIISFIKLILLKIRVRNIKFQIYE
jgi:hypothetical protein